MAKLRHCVDISILKNVYYALVYSYVRYGLMTWGNTASSNLSPLHTALHKILRIMTFAPFGNIDLQPIYDYLEVLNLDQIYLFELGKFLYKMYHNLLPSHCVGHYFEPDPYVNQHSYGLRSRTANVPTRLTCRTKFSEKSVQISGSKFWAKLPEDIRNSNSLSIFKKCLKTHLTEAQENYDADFLFD